MAIFLFLKNEVSDSLLECSQEDLTKGDSDSTKDETPAEQTQSIETRVCHVQTQSIFKN